MTTGVQAYLQGYLHEKTAGVYDDVNDYAKDTIGTLKGGFVNLRDRLKQLLRTTTTGPTTTTTPTTGHAPGFRTQPITTTTPTTQPTKGTLENYSALETAAKAGPTVGENFAQWKLKNTPKIQRYTLTAPPTTEEKLYPSRSRLLTDEVAGRGCACRLSTRTGDAVDPRP